MLASVLFSFVVERPVVVHAQRDLAGLAGEFKGVVCQGEGWLAGFGEFIYVDLAAIWEVERCL